MRGESLLSCGDLKKGRVMDAMVDFEVIFPWLDQPELGNALTQALHKRGMKKSELARAIIKRFGHVGASEESIATVFSKIEKGGTFTAEELQSKPKGVMYKSNYLLFAEQILGEKFNNTDNLIDYSLVQSRADKLLQSKDSPVSGKIHKLHVVADEQHSGPYVHNPTHAIDITEIEALPRTRERRVFATILGPGGTMQLMEKEASISAQLPNALEDVPEAYGVKISSAAMAAVGIGVGSIVWIDPRKPVEISNLVWMVPIDVSDVRRYICILTEITVDYFLAWQASPPAIVPDFLRTAWLCFKIVATDYS